MPYSSALRQLHHRRGVVWGAVNGMDVPLRFTETGAEYAALRTGAGLWDGSLLGLLRVTGADRTGFLHNLLTNDMKRLTPGHGCRAGLVTSSGKLLADLVVLADTDAHTLITDASCLDSVRSTLEHYHITEDVRVEDLSAGTVILGLFGPSAGMLTLRIDTVPEALHAHVRTFMDAAPLHAVRSRCVGVPGVLLMVPAEHAAWVWETLLDRGRAHGLLPVGWEAVNTVRIEEGMPWYGLDMDASNLLPETGLESMAVNDSKGCYIGQEVIARLATYGSVSRKLTKIRCEGRTVPERGDAITKDGELLGAITSACDSPAFKRPAALGYVKRPFYDPGTRVQITHGQETIAAVLTA